MRIFPNGRGLHPDASSALHLWTFAQTGTGSSLLDLCGGAATLTHANNPGLISLCPVEAGRSFDGVNQHFYGAADGADAGALLGYWVIACWIRPAVGYAARGYVVGYGGLGESQETNFLLSLRVNADLTLGCLWENGVGVNVEQDSTFTVPADRWSHIVVTRTSGNPCTLRFYLNGTLAETFAGLTFATATAGTQRWAVGIRANDLTTDPFQGAICSLGIWASLSAAPWTASDVEAAYWRGRGWIPNAVLHARVRIADSAGTTWTDVSTGMPDGRDWLSRIEVRDDVDLRGLAATVVLFREAAKTMSLAKYHDNRLNRTPLDAIGPDEGSYVENTSEFLANNRRVKISVARLPFGLARPALASPDWQEIFDGLIEGVEWASDVVTLQCTDRLTVMLLRAYHEQEANYSTAGGLVVETVMQDLLNYIYNQSWIAADPDTAGAISLYTVGDPSWVITAYRQARMDPLQALTERADQIGWVVRRRWHDDAAITAWRLTFYDPDRLRTQPDAVLDTIHYWDVTRLEQTLTRIRNVVRIVYPSTETTQTPSVGSPTSDGCVRSLGFQGGPNSNGDPTAGYTQWSNATSIAKYGRQFMEAGEAATSAINTIDEADRMALGILRDHKEPLVDQCVRMPALPELQVGDLIRWKANGRHYTADQTLAVVGWRLTLTADVCVTEVQCRGQPSGGSFRHMNCLDTRNGRLLSPVLDAAEHNTGLSWGVRRRVLHDLINATTLVRGDRGALVQTADFSSALFAPNDPPDGWGMQAGTWITDADKDTANGLSGYQCVTLKTATGKLRSNWFPVAQNGWYQVEVQWKASEANTAQVVIEWYQADKTASATPTTTVINDTVGTSWMGSRNCVQAPTDARWARLRLGRAAGAANVWVDSVNVAPVKPEFHAYLSTAGDQAVTAKQWAGNKILLDVESFDVGGGFNNTAGGTNPYAFTCPETGLYHFTGMVAIDDTEPAGQAALYKNGSPWVIGSAGALLDPLEHVRCPIDSGIQWCAKGNYVELWVYPEGTNPVAKTGATHTWLSGRLIPNE